MQVVPAGKVSVLKYEPLENHRFLNASSKHAKAQPVGLESAQLEDLDLLGHLQVVLEEFEKVDVFDVVLA